MAHRAIKEYFGKLMVGRLLERQEEQHGTMVHRNRCVLVLPGTPLDSLLENHPWLKTERLVAKPDQLIKRRGNHELVLLDADLFSVRSWIDARMGKEVTIGDTTGKLDSFIVEPFVPHKKEDEYYLAIRSGRESDEILFFSQGGVDVGDVDTKARRQTFSVLSDPREFRLDPNILEGVPLENHKLLQGFIQALYRIYVEAGFAYLEINPLVVTDNKVAILDLAAKLDDTAEFENGKYWGETTFSAPFGRTLTPQERYIGRLDAKSGASLKFSLLNPHGRIWTMVAGGGASVVYTDTIVDLGYGQELANYGEYSGNPTDEETFEYARTILELMCRERHPDGLEKILLIGGGIANFTDVAKTFRGITRAIETYADALKRVNARIYVRRGGPNHQEGLAMMTRLGARLGLPIEVYGPETHMTKIVGLALKRAA